MRANPECAGSCPVLQTDLEAINNSVERTNAMAYEDYRRHCVQSNECIGVELVSRNGAVVQKCPLFNVEVTLADRSEF